jgi:hypothetical protein
MTLSVSFARLPALALLFTLVGCQQKQDQPPPPPQPPPQTEAAPVKPKIEKLDDLPRHTYPVQGSVVDLVTSADKFAPFAAQVRANVEKDLTDLRHRGQDHAEAAQGHAAHPRSARGKK